jgi:DNA-binding MarR family transcriptional regulator
MTTQEENLRHAAETLLSTATELHATVQALPDAGDQLEWWVRHYRMGRRAQPRSRQIYSLIEKALKFAARAACAAEALDESFYAQEMDEEENSGQEAAYAAE